VPNFFGDSFSSLRIELIASVLPKGNGSEHGGNKYAPKFFHANNPPKGKFSSGFEMLFNRSSTILEMAFYNRI
jgi:hypothetical protein